MNFYQTWIMVVFNQPCLAWMILYVRKFMHVINPNEQFLQFLPLLSADPLQVIR